MSATEEDLLAMAAMTDDGDPEGTDYGIATEQDANLEKGQRLPLDDEQILSLVEHEINQAQYSLSGSSNNSNSDRQKAVDYYLGTARGDEIEGRSSVISMDVSDVIEWILPQCVRAFTMNESLVQFDPNSSDDEEQARLESEYVHHVMQKQENSYEFLYSFVKDALLAKNGISKTWWRTNKRRKLETYEELTDEELAQVLEPDNESEVEPLEHSEYQQEQPTALVAPERLEQARQQQQEIMQQVQQLEQQGAPPEIVQQAMQEAERLMEQIMPPETTPVNLHDLKLRRTRTRGEIVIKCVDPDRFLISRDADSLNTDTVRFTGHWEPVMASDLVAEGIPIDLVDDLPGYSYDDDDAFRDDDDVWDDSLDMSTRKIRVYECYLYVDRDGDGIAELLKVRCAGPDSFALIDIEEVDANPFASITPFILTHNFEGLSVFDKIKQVQDQKTVIWRQILDNLYQQNNRRTIVVDGQVNLDDLLVSRPGGVVRAATLDSVMPFPVEPIGQDGYTMLEYLDKVRTERTGTSPEGTSQAFPVGADTAHGLERLMTMKEELVGLIIRTMAETGFKQIALQVRELLCKYQNKSEQVKLSGTWVEINPNEWRDRVNTTVGVVLGVGDRIRRQASAEQVLAKQTQIVESGGMGILTTEGRIFNALRDYVRFGDLGLADDYFLDPNSDEAKQLAEKRAAEPPEPGDLEKAAMVTAEAEMKMADMKRDTAFKQTQAKAATDFEKQKAELIKERLSNEIKVLELQLKQAQVRGADNIELTKFYDDLTFKYDELEAQYQVDIAGQGTESGGTT